MQAGGRNIAPEFIYGWFVQLARATEYLHEHRVVHRDIKASNIFFYGPKLIKLGDLGLACRLDNQEDMDPAEFCGTPQYMCPDRLHERPYDARTDLWALGCLFYELSSLRRAFDMPANARTPRAALLALRKKVMLPEGPPPMPKVYPKEWKDLIRGLLSRDASDRPTLRDVFRMPFLKQAVQDVEDAFDEECDARPLPQPYGVDQFVLRALEETSAAQNKAANLCAETLAVGQYKFVYPQLESAWLFNPGT
jgi:serine/threonine protein kinase